MLRMILVTYKADADIRQSPRVGYAKPSQPRTATYHAAFLVLLPTGPTQMVCAEPGQNRIPLHLLTVVGFIKRTEAANWLNVAALVATTFLLLSFVVLPVKWTHRHYLSICLAIAVAFMEVMLDRKAVSRHLLTSTACLHYSSGIEA